MRRHDRNRKHHLHCTIQNPTEERDAPTGPILFTRQGTTNLEQFASTQMLKRRLTRRASADNPERFMQVFPDYADSV
jgi:hypothetical protein